MANLLLGIVALIAFSFYDPSLIIYQIGMVNEIAVGLIGALALFNHDKVIGLLFLSWRRQRALTVFCAVWLVWALYFVAHSAMGLTSFGFAATRVIRIGFIILFFFNIRKYWHLTSYIRVVVVFAVTYSVLSIVFHLVTLNFGIPAATLTHIPVVDLDYADLGIYGYMWPNNYSFPMRFGKVAIYRTGSFFNESAAFAFFLEPALFYVLHLRASARYKFAYSAAFVVILLGIVASTSVAGLAAVILSFLVLVLFLNIGIGKRIGAGLAVAFGVYLFMYSGAGVLDSVLTTKQATLALEAEGLERGMGLLHGMALLTGTGYDFIIDEDMYVSANAVLANLQRGGLIGLAFFALTILMMLKQLWSANPAKLMQHGRWAAFAMLPNFIHMVIKVNYEFTFIYLINFSLVFWYLNYVRANYPAPDRPG
ncbi:hypothetical protein [Massilia sp. TWP1-3-3]|uniref:hypothetical protein n=1 Tax=Massilia sp. TWP1-3-3 TaxID=2804573 RepID=UPI003CF45648